jgi:proton-coupled amino acid transporter
MSTGDSNSQPEITDQKMIDLVQQHLVQESDADVTNNNEQPNNNEEIPVPYHLPGAAITHDIYTHANNLVQSQTISRSRSLSDLQNTDNNTTFENLDKPGGFRRFHVHQQHRLLLSQQEDDSDSITNDVSNVAFQELFRPDSLNSIESRQQLYTSGLMSPDVQHPPVTRHFLEYLAITSYINQFAGEDLSDSEEDDTRVEDEEERTSLLPNKKRHQLIRRHSSKPEKANVTKTIFLLFKAFIGSGILFLPKAFSNGGLLFSVCTMWVMGGVSLFCFLLLLECKETLAGSYGDIGGHLYGPWMRSIVLFSIAISQLGFMCGGTIFIVENLIEAVRALSGNTILLNPTAIFVVLAILLTPLVWIRNIAKLSPTALLSDVLIVGGLIALLVFDIIEIFQEGIRVPQSGPGIHWVFNSAHYTVFIGTAVYSFEGIGLIIPIRDAMKKPERFPAVLTFVMVLVACTLCIVGALGYIAFGENVKTVALLNLPAGIIPNTVQLGYAVAVLLSNALALFPTIRIIEQGLFGDLTGKHNMLIKWEKNTLRTSIVLLGTLIAWGGANDLDKFISLIGSVCCCPLSLIFPPLFHLALPSTKGAKRIVDLGLITFGILVMLFTFYNTSKQWAESG